MRFSLLLASLVLGGTSGPTPVNLVVGDMSWIALHGAPPTARTSDAERIETHLLWVEARLRAEPPALNEVQAAERARLLDVLHGYALARRFPAQDTTRSDRIPRWVDSEGRHCAVAALVQASGASALVEEVLRRHEYDYVLDMDVPALRDWARDHGLTLDELALIQPTYDDGVSVEVPSEREEAAAHEARRRAARVPRPLTDLQVREVVERYVADARTVCADDRTGHWTIHTTLRVGRRFRVRATVEAREGGIRDEALERCLEEVATTRMRNVIRTANHRISAPIEAAHATVLDVYRGDEINRALSSDPRFWHGEGTRQAALALCMEGRPTPVEVWVRVRGWNGEVLVRWDDMGVDPRALSATERAFWYCIRDVIGCGRLTEHGVHDHDAILELSVDGSLRAVTHQRRPGA